MPFLVKKAVGSEADLSLIGSLTTNATGKPELWREDEYRPSARGFLTPDHLALPSSLKTYRSLCANEECRGGWTKPWRNRRRPIFEGRWGCSGRCVLAMVRAGVQREHSGPSTLAETMPHLHRVPLGLLMLQQGWITHPQLRRALEAQRRNETGRIGEWLISECSVRPELVTKGLTLQWSCPMLTTEGFSPDSMMLVAPKIFLNRFGAVPLRVAGSKILYLGFEQRLDASVAFAIEKMTDLKVESGLVEGEQFRSAQHRLLACPAVEAKQQTMADKDEMAGRMTSILEQKQPIASRFTRMHDFYWMRIWLENGAIGKTGMVPRTGEDVNDYIFVIGGDEKL